MMYLSSVKLKRVRMRFRGVLRGVWSYDETSVKMGG